MIPRFIILLICFGFGSSVWATTPIEDFNTGFRAYGEGNYNSAVDYCKKAVDANPKYWQAYQTMGNAYYKMGRLDDAQAAYQKSLEINPENPGLHQFVGSLRSSAPANASIESEDPLPQGGSFTWNVGLFGGAASLKDLTAIYGVTITGLTPMITGAEASVDHALFRDIQLGLQLEFMSRAAETLTLVPSGAVKVWSVSMFGPSLSLKFLIPLFPKINLVLRGTGGLYALMDSSVTTTSGGVTDKQGVDGFSPGETGEVQLELLQGNGFSIDGGLGYRSLVVTPITSGSSVSKKNLDGTLANLDLSCTFISCSLRFY